MSVIKSASSLLCLLFLTALAMYAQSAVTAQTTISGSDQAAAVSTTKFVYRMVPAATPAAKKLPASSLTNVKLASNGVLPKPGFYPADLSYHGGPVVRTAENNPIYFDCPAGPTACWGDPAVFLNDRNSPLSGGRYGFHQSDPADECP